MLVHDRRLTPVAITAVDIAMGACQATPGDSAPGSRAASASVPASPSASEAPEGPYAGAEAVIQVAAGPRGVAFADGSVWVASTIGDAVQRVDPVANRVTAEIRLVRPVTLVTVGDQLWASVLNGEPAGDDEVVRIDTSANSVAQRVGVPVFHNIASGGGALWAVDGVGELRRIDPASGMVTSLGSVGGVTIGIAARETAIWGIRDDGMAWRLPHDGGTLQEGPLGVEVPGRSRVAVGPGTAGSVWVAVPGSVLALGPDTLTIRTRLSLPGMELVNDLWVTDTDVWLSANLIDAALGLDGGSVLRLDPETAEVRATYRLGPESSGLIVAGDTLWAVDQRDGVLAAFFVGR